MALIKVKERFQVTIPAPIRKKLGLKVGDYLEIKASGDCIVLKPVAVVDRRRGEALEKLEDVLERVRGQLGEIPEEEVEREVLEALRAIRAGTGG